MLTKKPPRKNRARSLHCEPLERREMLTAGITASLTAGGVLNVVGTDNADQIRFLQSGKNISIVGVNGFWSASQVQSIYVDGRGGDDFVSLNSFANGGNKAIKEHVTIIGGAGTDRVNVGKPHDVYVSGQGNHVKVDAKGVVTLNNATVNLASTATASLKSGVLTVTGTNGNDNFKFAQVNNKIYITGVSGSFAVNKVRSIVISLQNGNDAVSLHSLANGGNQALTVPVTIYSGAGNDMIRLANGRDVAMDGAHVLHVAYGVAKLDGQTLTWDEPEPTPPPPPPPPTTDWFQANIADAALRDLGSSLYTDGILNRADMLALFQNAQDGGVVDATEFSDLKKIVSNSTLFGTFDYVWKLSTYIVDGSVANAKYQGQNMGNLASGSSAAHLQNLVNKWFLGLDRPTAGGTYRQFTGQLFVNGVAYTDIRQGTVGDCYLLASLAEVALRSPAVINNMFVVNGDGTYTVKFFNAGQANFVTVDSYLPTNGSGNAIYAAYGTNYTNAAAELWVALAEKAYVQANEFGWIRPGLTGSGQNAYSAISGGYIYASLGHVTGQSTIAFASTASSTSFNTFVSAWNAGKSIGFASKVTPASSTVVGSHAYTVVGYNSSTQTVTLYNPWGPSYVQLTLSWSEIQANFSYFDRTA
jgi:hypothetical protein